MTVSQIIRVGGKPVELASGLRYLADSPRVGLVAYLFAK
jgi:hypothetical protein